MDKKQEEIVAKKIESGEYFQEAISWFHVKFTRPRTEASYFFIIAVIAIAALAVGIAAFSRMFPLAPGYSFVIGRTISPHDNIKISSIANYGDSVNTSVVNYLLNQYVRSREEYIEKNIDRNQRIVAGFSNEEVMSEYQQDISLSNPQNPIIRYGNQATREIQINSIQLRDSLGRNLKENMVPASAIVRYTNILTFLGDSTREITREEADITFQYDQIIVDQETGEVIQKPKLVITGYRTRTLE